MDAEIAKVARRQQGNVTRRQLLDLGLSSGAITYRCQKGLLHREHGGVYSVGRPATTALEQASAAVLACGPGAALSHWSALTLWGLHDKWYFPLHVTAPRDCRRPGIITHRSHALTKRDIRTQRGIRATSLARTLLDCAPTMTRKRLRRGLADGRRADLTRAALHDVLNRFPTHAGYAALRHAFRAYQPTRSEFEDDFPGFCSRHGLPIPLINTIVNGDEVDAYFPDHNLIVELDSWGFHQDRHNFESDRDRDATQLAHGLPTVRITWERITETPAKEAQRLKRILAARGPTP